MSWILVDWQLGSLSTTGTKTGNWILVDWQLGSLSHTLRERAGNWILVDTKTAKIYRPGAAPPPTPKISPAILIGIGLAGVAVVAVVVASQTKTGKSYTRKGKELVGKGKELWGKRKEIWEEAKEAIRNR